MGISKEEGTAVFVSDVLAFEESSCMTQAEAGRSEATKCPSFMKSTVGCS